MKIEKDAEWLRLEEIARQKQKEAQEAAAEYRNYCEASVVAQLGLVLKDTIVKVPKRGRFLVQRVDARGWVSGVKIGRNGKPNNTCAVNLFDEWEKE